MVGLCTSGWSRPDLQHHRAAQSGTEGTAPSAFLRVSFTSENARPAAGTSGRHAAGTSLDHLLPEAFAVAREAAWRVLDQRPFDVQVMGGAALHFGNVAEMMTREGKTLGRCCRPTSTRSAARACTSSPSTTTCPSVTASGWAGCTGSSASTSGWSSQKMTPDERRAAYNADITYG